MVKELLVTERELIYRLSLITGHGPEVVRDVIKAQTEFIMDELKNGIPVRLGALGELHVIKYSGNGGYDFENKQVRAKKEIKKIKFKVSKTFKRAINED